MTHRSASRCLFATRPTCWRPGNVACPERSPGTCSSAPRPTPHAPRPTPHAPCRRLEIGFVFACSIPHLFVLSHSLPMVNTMGKLALFGAFLSPPAPFPRDSRTTIHSPLASPPTFHAPRSSGVRRRCRAPSWVQHSPPGRRQHAMKSYFSGFRRSLASLVFGAT